jgi:hypothetical protein
MSKILYRHLTGGSRVLYDEFKAERTRKRIQRKAIYQQEIDDGFRSDDDYKNVSENSDSDDSDNYETDDEDDEV